MLPGRVTVITMKRPMGTVTGASLCDGCTGYSGHRVLSTRRRRATDRFPFPGLAVPTLSGHALR